LPAQTWLERNSQRLIRTGRFSRADFSQADLSETQFYRAVLQQAKFRRAVLRAARLQEIKAEGADFTLADLSDADA